MNPGAVDAALELDPAWRARLRAQWLEVADCAVFGDLQSSRLGALARMRRRVLDAGERLRALIAARAWIPHPRERLKNALAGALGAREALAELQRATDPIDGGPDRARLLNAVADLGTVLDEALPALEERWAQLLDSQYREARDDD
ncbi:MAG: hypothetical protein AB7N65_10300 [Vicinamibacterales bacterium]